MRFRELGSSTLRVSEIALGSWLTYGGGVERSRAAACVKQALELGINLIDTAKVYGRGAAESFMGEALEGVPRDSYVLATKLFFPMSPQDRGLSRAQIRKQLGDSLRRLRTDYVDLYQCHRYDPETPLQETMAALTEVVREGKVRFIGFSEWPVDKIKAAGELADVERFVSSQPQYSLLWRAPEDEVIPFCRGQGISQIVWSPLAQGLLTGKYRPGVPIPMDSRAASSSMGGFVRKNWLTQPALQAIQEVEPLARRNGLTLAQFALAWVLRERNVASAIIGATRPQQIVENAAAADANVDPEDFKQAERLLQSVH
jgi:aryl-alcohol dehydrogenase-like predicted oxidoreductase